MKKLLHPVVEMIINYQIHVDHNYCYTFIRHCLLNEHKDSHHSSHKYLKKSLYNLL